MSWAIVVAGKDKEALKAKVNEDANCPATVKAVICGQLDAMTVGTISPNGYKVETSGHLDNAYGGNGTFSVMRINVLD